MSAACEQESPAALPNAGLAALTMALVGRPNSGKSSVYNALTGGAAHVGNYPGITVEILEGDVSLPSGASARIADLPGFYSVEASVDPATDEGVARAFIDAAQASEQPFVLVHVIDPTRLALGLRLTRELLHTKLPLVVVVTHKDVLLAEGRKLDTAALARAIGTDVVFVNTREPRACDAILSAVEARGRARQSGAPAEVVDFDPSRVAHAVLLDTKNPGPRATTTTTRLDAVLLHPVLGPVLFLAIMTLTFAAVFLIADPAATLMDALLGTARVQLTSHFGKNLVTSFFADGVLGGAGTVLAFMPQIIVLTVALELLEASGYLARGAFLIDRVLSLLGLSGRSFLPLLMGHACAVPAIAATRIVRDPRERLTTMLVIPLLTCSARLPTYGLVLATFFAGRSALFRAGLFVALYFAGIATALAASLVLRRTATRGKSLPLVLEIPSYRMPQARAVLQKALTASRHFLRDVGTVIVGVSAVLWVLVTVPVPGSHAEAGIERSFAATIGRTLEPVTAPAGFDWRINVGLLGSFGAREVMVGTLGVIFGVENAADDPAPLTERLREAKSANGSALYTTRTGLALLAFFVLACQCMSTVAAIKRETGSWRWPGFVVVYTYALAYVAAVFVYQVSGLLGVT
jgi:ferrous iron transport protein B